MEESTAVGMVMQQPVEALGGEVAEERRRMKLMVAVDDSEVSFYALRWALDHLISSRGLASAAIGGGVAEMETTMITLVHVKQPSHDTAFYTTPSVEETVRKTEEGTSALILSRALQMCKEKMVKAETLILHGDPKDMICQATEQMHIDLLVVGSRGLGKIKRALLGSVSDYCAHYANCPILIVKSPKDLSKQ